MPDLGRLASESSPASDEAPVRAIERAILVVDDEAAVRRFVADALRSQGHEVIVAPGGREALRAIYERSSTPAVVVSDIEMPMMSGVELAARLSAERPGIRVVLMTGRPDSAELARAHPDVVSAVLLKPFSTDDLLAAVDRALTSPE